MTGPHDYMHRLVEQGRTARCDAALHSWQQTAEESERDVGALRGRLGTSERMHQAELLRIAVLERELRRLAGYDKADEVIVAASERARRFMRGEGT